MSDQQTTRHLGALFGLTIWLAVLLVLVFLC